MMDNICAKRTILTNVICIHFSDSEKLASISVRGIFVSCPVASRDPDNKVPTLRSVSCSEDRAEASPAEYRQASMPSVHVWSTCVSPASPQFLNQAPPRAQQLRLPNFLVMPHLWHLLLLLTTIKPVGVSGSAEECVRQHHARCRL